MKPKFVGVSASELVILAIHNLEVIKKCETGSTHSDITKFISEKYNVDSERIQSNVRAALLRGLTFGILAEKDGRYRLEDVPQAPLDFPENDKIKSMIVATSSEAFKNKRKRMVKKSDVRLDDTVRPLVGSREKVHCKDCYQLAKRRRGEKLKKEEEDEDDDRNFGNMPNHTSIF